MEQLDDEFAWKRDDSLALAMRMTTPGAPVQYEGMVQGRPFYFRARWDTWRFAIADTFDEAVRANENSEAVFFRSSKYGTGPYDASAMDLEEAEAIIRACVAEYLAERGG